MTASVQKTVQILQDQKMALVTLFAIFQLAPGTTEDVIVLQVVFLKTSAMEFVMKTVLIRVVFMMEEIVTVV
jgi:hypothetical protein